MTSIYQKNQERCFNAASALIARVNENKGVTSASLQRSNVGNLMARENEMYMLEQSVRFVNTTDNLNAVQTSKTQSRLFYEFMKNPDMSNFCSLLSYCDQGFILDKFISTLANDGIKVEKIPIEIEDIEDVDDQAFMDSLNGKIIDPNSIILAVSFCLLAIGRDRPQNYDQYYKARIDRFEKMTKYKSAPIPVEVFATLCEEFVIRVETRKLIMRTLLGLKGDGFKTFIPFHICAKHVLELLKGARMTFINLILSEIYSTRRYILSYPKLAKEVDEFNRVITEVINNYKADFEYCRIISSHDPLASLSTRQIPILSNIAFAFAKASQGHHITQLAAPAGGINLHAEFVNEIVNYDKALQKIATDSVIATHFGQDVMEMIKHDRDPSSGII